MSVVVPCHEYGCFLPEALDSLLSQTRPPDEVVVVDDGSTDDTQSVLDRYETRLPGVRRLHRSPARGPASTFNDGVRASSGDLVVILSADDRMSDTYLECLERPFADATVTFAYAGEHLFGAIDDVRPVQPFDLGRFRLENTVNGSAMFRRTAFDAADGFRNDLDDLALEDWEFWAHLVANGGRGVPVEECWLEYRRHPAGSRNDFTPLAGVRAHVRMWRLHPEIVRLADVIWWFSQRAWGRLRRGRTRVRPPVAR